MVGFFLISVFVVFSVSLLGFIDRTEWEELEERNAARLSSNKSYGVYKLRTTNSLTVVSILGGLIAILLIYFLGTAVARAGGGSQPNVVDESSKYVDTTQFSMNLDEQIKELPPNSFNQNGNNGDNMPQAQRGAPEKSDDPERFKDNSSEPRPEKPKNMTQEEYQKALEQSFFDEFKDNADARQKKLEQNERDKKAWEEKNKAKQKQVNGGNGGVSGSSASTVGQASVTWKFSDNRDAYEGKKWNVPVPAYTCGNSSDAKVVVKVKVDAGGKVTSANIISSTLDNSCIKNNALTYARKSRFETSSMPEQEGTITYIYKAQ